MEDFIFFITGILGIINIYAFVAIFIPKKLLFFISEEEERKRWKAIAMWVAVLFVAGMLDKAFPKEEAKPVSAAAVSTKSTKNNEAAASAAKIRELRADSTYLADIIANPSCSKGWSVGEYGTFVLKLQMHDIGETEDFFKGTDTTSGTEQSLNCACELLAVKIHKKAMPTIRKNYGKVLRGTLYDKRTHVVVSGKGNTVISLTSYMFVVSQKVEQIHGDLKNSLYNLGFKRVIYYGFDGDEDAMSFDL